MPASSSPLNRPLCEIASTLPRVARTMPLEKLGSFLREDARGDSPLSGIDQVAEAILRLPLGTRRMREVARAVIAHALAVTQGNVSQAAELLGVTRQAVQRHVRRSARRAD